MVKIIDRYLVRSFLLPLAYCLLAVQILFIAYDLSDKLKDFFDANVPPDMIVRYYLYNVPIVFSMLAPFAILLALLYCLGNLSRNNEIIAMRASGIALFRIVRPYLVLGFILYVVTLVASEAFVPTSKRLAAKIVKQPSSVRVALVAQSDGSLISFVNAQDDRSWAMAALDPESNTVNGVTVTSYTHSQTMRKSSTLEASSGEFVPGFGWWFYDVTLIRYAPDGTARPAAKFRKCAMRYFTETPADMLAAQPGDVEMMTFFEILKAMRHLSIKSDFFKKLSMELQRRIAGPAACFVFVLLAAPFGIHHTRAGMVKGVITSIMLCLGYYVIAAFFINLGQKGLMLPIIAAWLPNVACTGIGIYLLRQMR